MRIMKEEGDTRCEIGEEGGGGGRGSSGQISCHWWYNSTDRPYTSPSTRRPGSWLPQGGPRDLTGSPSDSPTTPTLQPRWLNHPTPSPMYLQPPFITFLYKLSPVGLIGLSLCCLSLTAMCVHVIVYSTPIFWVCITLQGLPLPLGLLLYLGCASLSQVSLNPVFTCL